MARSKISERCVIICFLGLTSVTYVTLGDSVILFYSMPVGQTTRNGKVKYEDRDYNGEVINGIYKNGTGILTVLLMEWNATLTQSQYIDITFEFSDTRKFTDVTLTVNVDDIKRRGNAVFNRSQIFLSSSKTGFSDTSILQYCPRDFQAKNGSNDVTLSLCENTARFFYQGSLPSVKNA